MESVKLAIVAGQIDAPLTATLGGRIALVTLHREGLRKWPRRERVFHADQVTAGSAVEWFETNIPGETRYHIPRWAGYVTASDGETVTVQRCRSDDVAVSAAAQWRRDNAPARPKEWWEDGYEDAADSVGAEAAARENPFEKPSHPAYHRRQA